MTLAASIAPLLTHFVPIVYFIYILSDMLLRSHKKAEYLLVSGIFACCLSLFLEEFVRQYIPIEYSPVITGAWFSISGITIVGLGMHLFIKLTNMDHRLPKFVYPYLFYLPTLIVVLYLIFNDQMISGSSFYQTEIWKMPVYNAPYYIAMLSSNIFNIIYILILWRGIVNTGQRELREIYRHLTYGVLITLFFNLTIGIIDFKGYLPPYPYIYGTLLWCILLRQTMKKYEFLNHEEVRFEKLFQMSPAAIVLTTLDGQVREANPAAKKLFNILNIKHGNINTLLQGELLERIDRKKAIEDAALAIPNGDSLIELVIDGDHVMFEYKPHLILIIRDVTAQMKDQRELRFIAYHDMLTKLPNRKHFFEQLHEALIEAEGSGQRLAVLLFDLDRFKDINDKFGHLAGDKALVQVADSIRSILSEAHFAARLGGDEFIIFFRTATEEKVKEKIKRLTKAISSNPLIVGEEIHPLQVSIGVSFYPEHGRDIDTLLNNADKALYYVKRSGRNHYAFASNE